MPTTTPGVDSLPQHTVYSTGGFPDTGPYTGTVTVQNAGSLNHAAVLTTTQGGTGSNFMDTQFLNSQPYNNTSFDINVLTTPGSAAGIPQDGQAFAINAFERDASGRDWRFIVLPNALGTGGEFALRDNTSDGNPIPFAPYVDGQSYHVSIDSDFNTGVVFASVGTFTIVTPMINAPTTANTGLSELFFFQNDVEGVTNSVAVDNIISVSNDVATPLPRAAYGSLALLALIPLTRRRQPAP